MMYHIHIFKMYIYMEKNNWTDIALASTGASMALRFGLSVAKVTVVGIFWLVVTCGD